MAAPPRRLRRRDPRRNPPHPAPAHADHHSPPRQRSHCRIHGSHRLRPLHPPPQTIPVPAAQRPGIRRSPERPRQPTPPARRLHPQSFHRSPVTCHPPASAHPPTRRRQNPPPQPTPPRKRHLRRPEASLNAACPLQKPQRRGRHPPTAAFRFSEFRKSGDPHFFFAFRPAFNSS